MENNQNKNKDVNVVENSTVDENNMINKKRRNKTVAIIGGIIVVMGIAGTMMFGNVNKAQNEFVSISATVTNLRSNMIERNELILSVKDELKKYDEANVLLEKLEVENKNLNKLSQSDRENYGPENTKEVNENFEILKGVEKSSDNLLELYNSNEEMKKNKLLSDAFEDAISYDNAIDYLVESYNIEYKDMFNKAINKFPVNMMKKKYNIIEMEDLNLK